MKSVVVTNQKGGVGKSAVVTQLAYYCGDKLGLRTLVIDLDAQANTSKPIKKSGLATIADHPASAYLLDKNTPLPSGNFVLIPGDDGLGRLEKRNDLHNTFGANMRHLMQTAAKQFDICIIDTNPMTDIRMLVALVASDFVLSPTQMNQEAIDGIGALRRDMKNIQDRGLNPNLKLLGLLPNLVTPTPFQKRNFAEIAKHFGKLLIPMDNGGFAHLKERTAVAEAQAAGKPIYSVAKTSSREAWREWEEVLKEIVKQMGVEHGA